MNSADTPAAPGTVIMAYLTGQGELDVPIPSGAPAAADPLSRPKAAITVQLGEQSVEIVDAFMTPGEVGLLQVAIRLPEIEAGDYPMAVTINDAVSNSALVSVGSRVVTEKRHNPVQ